jgi:hypothetical protein
MLCLHDKIAVLKTISQIDILYEDIDFNYILYL